METTVPRSMLNPFDEQHLETSQTSILNEKVY